MKKLLIVSAFIALQILLVQQPVFAINEDNRQGKLNLKEEKSQTKEQQCAKAIEKITAKISAYEANRNGKETVYANLLTKISEIITRLKDKGYDVSKIETDLTTLTTKIEKYWTDRKAVTDTLESSKSSVCSEPNTQFRETLKQSKDLFEVVKTDIKDIRLFVSQTIRSDIQALKSQKVDKSVDNETL